MNTNLLTLEDEKFKTVEVKGYKFKVKFISPLDRIQITQKRLAFQNGNPVECLTQDEFTFLENIATIDVCTDEYPDGFDSNKSCVNWDDSEIINELATNIRTHTLDIESRLKKNKPIGGSE